MIHFESFILENGLRVVVHEDPNSHISVVNILYDVGSRDETPPKTGFAHLFEHLMFGGSKHITSYDSIIQEVGGNNNAYTTQDLTNYYCALPTANLETAFWLESDRMLALSFDSKVLEIQKKVVIEEFKECYLNQPYGDVWLQLTALAYRTHPYQWPTIGQSISHIEQVTMEDVKDFFYKFYVPNNAILVVAGNVKIDEVKHLSKKWFSSIPKGIPYVRQLTQEAEQKAPRKITVQHNVPLNALYKAYHIPAKNTPGYHATELFCHILGEGKSSKLYKHLVEDKKYFSNIEVETTESFDPGLFIISGYMSEGVIFEEAESAINEVINEIQITTPEELNKAKNQIETHIACNKIHLLHRAQELAVASLLGDPNLVNYEVIQVQNVTLDDVKQHAMLFLNENNCSTIYYKSIEST